MDLEIGTLECTGVDAVTVQALRAVEPLDLIDHVDGRRFGGPVREPAVVCSLPLRVREVERGIAVSGARHGNHAGVEGRGRRSEEGGTKQGEEQEVSKVVGLELEFVAVGGDGVRGIHHGGVVDEDVELVVGAVAEEFGGTGSDAGEAGVVHVQEVDAAGGDCDGADCFFGFGNVTSGAVDSRACGGKGADGLDTNAGGDAGDEDDFV